jgi:hypothetical protein
MQLLIPLQRGFDGIRIMNINDDGFTDITTGWEEGGITKLLSW